VILGLLVPKLKNSLALQPDSPKRVAPELPSFVFVLLGPRVRPLVKTLIGLSLCVLLALLPGVTNTKVLDGTEGQFYFSVSSAAFCSYGAVSVILVALSSLERGWIMPIPGVSTFLEYIGSRSYSLYLGHMLVIYVYNDLYFRLYEYVPDMLRLTRIGYLLQCAAVLLAAIGLAELSYRLIETPFRNVGKQINRSLMGTTA
jgi:peptidoglycan/LPS O-acetylase OafA/YrhL